MLASQFRWLPSVRRYRPGTRAVVGLGLLGSAAVGAAAAAIAWWWPVGPACAQIASTETGALVAAAGHLLVGGITVRWLTAEGDRVILRQAVHIAATAPAAHPDTVRAMTKASPDAIYEVVMELIPRGIEH